MKRKGNKPPLKMARVYSFATRSITRIPESELAPGMVQAEIEGVPGTVWIDAASASDKLGKSSFQHPPFTGETRWQIEEIQRLFSGVREAMDYDAWEDGFRRDQNPREQVKAWLIAGRTLAKHTLANPTIPTQEIYRLIVACLNASPDSALQIFERDKLSKTTAEEIIADYCKGFEVEPSPPAPDNTTAFPEYRGTGDFIRTYQSKKLIEGADIILTLPVSPKDHPEVFYGKATLQRIIDGMPDSEVTGVVYRIDWATDEPEMLLAAIQVLRGKHDR